MLELKTVEEIPKPRRGNKGNSQERKQIQDQLRSGKVGLIEGVEAGNKFNTLQQRIRSAGKDIGVKVTITFQKSEDGETGDVYFVQNGELSEAKVATTSKSKASK